MNSLSEERNWAWLGFIRIFPLSGTVGLESVLLRQLKILRAVPEGYAAKAYAEIGGAGGGTVLPRVADIVDDSLSLGQTMRREGRRLVCRCRF